MSDLFRVRVAPVGGADVACELFEARSDAEKMFGDVTGSGADALLDGMGVPSMTVALEQLCNGCWTTASRKLVVRRPLPPVPPSRRRASPPRRAASSSPCAWSARR